MAKKRTAGRRVVTDAKMRPVVRDAVTVREDIRDASLEKHRPWNPVIRHTAPKVPRCDDCRALTAFHAWRSVDMGPSFNTSIHFNPSWGIPPGGKRAVIELVTATISVPSGEFARLRMFTSLESAASNLDFVLTPQGTFAGRTLLVATHSVRVYSDGLIDFNVNRDNAQTSGHAFICLSGYLVDE